MDKNSILLASALFITAGAASAQSPAIQSGAIQSDSIPAPALPSLPGQSRPIQLEEAISLALNQNRTIAMARKDTDHYEQLKAKARADYFPHISNSSEVSHITDREGIVIPAGSFGAPSATGPIPARSLRIDQGGNTTYFSRTQLTQPLTQLFSIREENRSATADVRRSAAAEVNTRIETVANVHRHFYGVLVAREQVVAAQAALLAAAEREHEAQANFREGSALNADVQKAGSQRAQANAAVVAAKTQEHEEQTQLNTLLSLPVDTPLDPQLPPAPPEGTSALPGRAEALNIALVHEPRVLEAQQEVEKAHAGVRLAQDAYIPSITATAHESYQSGVAFFVHNYGVFSGQVAIDLFDGGKRQAQIRDARALLKKAELALDEQREQTGAAVEVTYDQVDEAEADLVAKRLAASAASESERESQSRFRNGEILPSERDAATAARASAQASLLEAQLNLALARVQVQRVLGQIPH